MKYNSEHYYRTAYGIMAIVLMPFFILNVIVGDESNNFIPSIMMLTPLMVGCEYSYIFPRQAMKLYEEILFKSFIERINGIIQFSIFIIFSITESCYFITDNPLSVFIFIIAYAIWPLIFKSQSVMIGNKNIIIGKKFVSHDFIQSVSLEEDLILIKTDEELFKINNWAIGKKRWKLEQVLKQITEER